MLAYKFKMTFEDQDEFLREIELRADQTFFDFYNFIMDQLKLDSSLSASFFMCDHKYRKKKEIFHPTNIIPVKSRKSNFKEEAGETAKLVMDKCELSDIIDDPHQRFLFVYDLLYDWSFYLELIKIVPAQPQEKYPRIVKSLAGTPSELVKKPVFIPGPADEEFDDEMEGDELIIEDVDSDEEHDHGIVIQSSDDGYSEEDIDELSDDTLFNDSIEMGEDFDEINQRE